MLNCRRDAMVKHHMYYLRKKRERLLVSDGDSSKCGKIIG